MHIKARETCRWKHRFGSFRERQRGVSLVLAAVLLGAAASGLFSAPPARAQDDPLALTHGEAVQFASVSYLDNAELPPAVGQADFAVYIPQTGHTLSGVFLDYWRATGEETTFGFPISEPFATPEGDYAQVFEGGVLQYLPLKVWTVEPFVRPMPIGRLLLGEQVSGFGAGAGGKRLASGSRSSGTRPLAADDPAVKAALAAHGYYDKVTQHTISGAFFDWYWRHEGDYYLGAPLSEVVTEDGLPAQWFEQGMLIQAADGVRMAPLGERLAQRFGVSTARVPADGAPDYNESLFATGPNPAPVDTPPLTPAPKRIEVSIAQQRLRAYEGSTVVLETPVSTGLPPNTTEKGRFRVRYKTLSEDMRGATDAQGDVVWVVGDGGSAPAGSIPYGVPDVPNVMYVNLDAEALHGAYWHNNFGQRMSHGCINLPLPVAQFLYGWAPLGTPVTVF